ncbi:hypothetical protein [Desulfitobacterium chlororespirans]|uniref:Uncharacterized protein n=1 Tax=Desulfitobacterium chlororespirans DSM 11544 TaxID=1121395 RepID=A0A1M7U2U7_9FIRM|nr:hypothetical protein [Desulfitobacterium chlororespirans]SHN77392.1 hypothetical protein SAMN02745215_02879 [Desulfitobacterium chlororespirans DSM 11544]
MSDILRWDTVKTRKPHKCFGCGKIYPVGTMMVNAAYADGESAWSCYWCETCREYMRRYFEPGDEVGEGEILDNDLEGWEELRAEMEGKP